MTIPRARRLRLLVHRALAACSALALAPLVLASLTLPFGWTDHFAAIGMYMTDGCCSLGFLLPNLIWHLFYSDFVVRPTATLFYSLQFLLFGGEFWLWFLVKWMVKFAAIGLAASILRTLRVSLAVRWCVAALLLFHPISTEFNLFSLDLLSSAGCLLLLFVLIGQDRESNSAFDIAALSPGRYRLFLAVFLLTLGIKEISFAYCGVLTLALALWSARSRRTILRLTPCFLSLAFMATRLLANSSRAGALTARIFSSNLSRHLLFLTPQSPYHLFTVALVGLLVLAVLGFSPWGRLRWADPRARRVGLFSMAAAVAMLAFTSVITRPYFGASTRYVVPSLFLLSLPIGLASARLPRPSIWGNAAFLLLYPLLQFDDLCVQGLAWQQRLFEQADMITLLQDKAAQGYTLAIAGDSEFYGEVGENVRMFFGTYGAQFYGQRPVRLHNFPAEQLAERFAVLSIYDPGLFRSKFAPHYDLHRLERAQAFTPGDYGLLENLHRKFYQLNGLIRNLHFPRYDPVGAPQFHQNTPSYYLYTFRASTPPAGTLVSSTSARTEREPSEASSLAMEWERGSLRSPSVLANGQTFDAANAGTSAVIFPLNLDWDGDRAAVSVRAEYQIEAWKAYFGVTSRGANDLYNVELPADGKPHQLPSIPALRFSPGTNYYAFIYLPRGATKLHVRNLGGLESTRVEMLRSSRRFGAIMR